jgi:hypothetical protein
MSAASTNALHQKQKKATKTTHQQWTTMARAQSTMDQ